MVVKVDTEGNIIKEFGKNDINESQPVEIDGSEEIFLGQVVNNKDEAYNLYQKYAFRKGFSVGKGRVIL
uniref:FAR1 DNA-binding domain protein n=1 Tax=Medicago truncatula TaxID=3880 RepID=A2Q1E7_MEDTR|nr:hypothetical protein MtrDRAFT_AC148775g42v2 [Medicago truncatula]